MALILNWIKCKGGGRPGDHWCNLLRVKLDGVHFNNMEGVYVIWHGGQDPTCLRVGQGFIRERLAAHRQDPGISAYRKYGLYATWAPVAASHRDGVERYLAETLVPKIGGRFPEVNPIKVNLPR